MDAIRVGDTVYRTDFLEHSGDVTTHPGVPGLVTHVAESSRENPAYVEVTFTLNQYTFHRSVRADKLRLAAKQQNKISDVPQKEQA